MCDFTLKTDYIAKNCAFSNLFPELTNSQFIVLYQYSIGCSVKIIAANTKRTIDTINSHLKALRFKLGCGSSSELRVIYLNRVMIEMSRLAV